MEKKENKKDIPKDAFPGDLFDLYIREMDELIRRYPSDPNKLDLTEESLSHLIGELDANWTAFQKKWKHKLELEDARGYSVRVRKDKKDQKHLVVKREGAGKTVLDLAVDTDDKRKK